MEQIGARVDYAHHDASQASNPLQTPAVDENLVNKRGA
jgi:hypothetical protein